MFSGGLGVARSRKKLKKTHQTWWSSTFYLISLPWWKGCYYSIHCNSYLDLSEESSLDLLETREFQKQKIKQPKWLQGPFSPFHLAHTQRKYWSTCAVSTHVCRIINQFEDFGWKKNIVNIYIFFLSQILLFVKKKKTHFFENFNICYK